MRTIYSESYSVNLAQIKLLEKSKKIDLYSVITKSDKKKQQTKINITFIVHASVASVRVSNITTKCR